MRYIGWLCTILGPVIGAANMMIHTEPTRFYVLATGVAVFAIGDICLLITAMREED